jgi:DNA repair protein RecO (recombination protein O)
LPATFDTALVLRLYDWSETSQIAILLTRKHGLVRAMAKGARRPVAKFSGGFELLTAGTAGLLIKPEADLATVTEWDLTDPFWHLRRSLGAFYKASLTAELLQRMIIDREPQPTLFAAAIDYLHTLRQQPDEDAPLLGLLWLILEHLGYQPQVHAMLSGEALPECGFLQFSPEYGGLVAHPATSAGEPSAVPGPLWTVRATTIARLSRLDEYTAQPPSRVFEVDEDSSAAEGPETRRATRLLVSYCEYITAQPLNSRRFCFPEWVSPQPATPYRNGPGQTG